ncbi:MAG TPA: nitrophenyl compound nitroreductase subunit ArsF family protein [Sedimentisphaerales bacterium]|nr:nitrophenyl compound nitroreductase subunit ArsF family protein [Sedimentisphaerales bacterium]
MDKAKIVNVMKHTLLTFLLATIGVVIGKEMTLRRGQHTPSQSGITQGNQVVVYYAHATIRCVTCETIERLTHETLAEQFAEVLVAGTLVFKDVDFQRDAAFAKQYEIVANCVVVSRIESGRERTYRRLDGVWELYPDPPAFKRYLGDAIRTCLDALPGGGA